MAIYSSLTSGPFDAPVRALSSRTKADLRAIATTLEAFKLDYGHYPGAIPISGRSAASKPSGVDPGQGPRRPGLTTPVAYITALYFDLFDASIKGSKANPYAYYNDDKGGWILYSVGPDGDYDIDPPRDYDSGTTVPSTALIRKTYDPTNGTKSDGDIYRFKD